jgi:probable HAF family extracellular repeat protein
MAGLTQGHTVGDPMAARRSGWVGPRCVAALTLAMALVRAGSGGAWAADEPAEAAAKAPSSCAHAINSGGVVVGESGAADGIERAFVWRPGDAGAGVAAHMEALGKAGGPPGLTAASGINDNGIVVGWLDTPGQRTAFAWDLARGERRLLPPLSVEHRVVEAYAVGNQGLAVGNSDFVPVCWDLGREPAVCERLLSGDEIAAHGSRAYAINGRGEIVGWGHSLSLDPVGFLCAWSREAGKVESRPFDFANWEPWAVNDELDIAGHFYPDPVLWQVKKRELNLLPRLDGTSWGVARGINAQPMAVGYCGAEGGGPSATRACQWHFDRSGSHYMWHWAVQPLGGLGGAECGSEALATNDRGQVVGRSETAPGSGVWHACLWERGREGKWSVRDLGTLS